MQEGNVLLNDALDIFYLRLYGVRQMIKDHSDSERGNPLTSRHGILFVISSKGSLIYTIPHQDNTYQGFCYTSCGALAGMLLLFVWVFFFGGGFGGVGGMFGFWERERNVLFNDALNTFYLRLYGVRHMVKDHSDSEKGNPLPPHGLLFPINS